MGETLVEACRKAGLKFTLKDKQAVRDGPFEFLGGAWVIFGETVFFFSSAGKPGYFFSTG